MKTLIAVTCLIAMQMVNAGCASSKKSMWEQSFRPAPTTHQHRGDAVQSVEVRRFDLADLESGVTEQSRLLAQWDIAVEDLSEDQQSQLHRILLEAFRYRKPAVHYMFVGSSRFWHEKLLDPYDGSLAQVARRHGANVVFVNHRYAGTEVVTDVMPVYGPVAPGGPTSGTADAFSQGFSQGASMGPRGYTSVQRTVDRNEYYALFFRVGEAPN